MLKKVIISIFLLLFLVMIVGTVYQQFITLIVGAQAEEEINVRQCAYDETFTFDEELENFREKVKASLKDPYYTNLTLAIYEEEIENGKEISMDDVIWRVNEVIEYVNGTKHDKAEMIAQSYVYGKDYMEYLNSIHDTHSLSNAKKYEKEKRDNEESTEDSLYFFGRRVLFRMNKDCNFRIPSGTWGVPTDEYVISCDFMEWELGVQFHYGIDLAYANIFGKPLYAVTDGIIIDADKSCSVSGGYIGNMCNQGSGNFVIMKVTVDEEKQEYIYIHYCHMGEVSVEEGQEVVLGQEIGTVGNSGNSTGAHLHFEMRTEPNHFGWSNTSDLLDPHMYIDF